MVPISILLLFLPSLLCQMEGDFCQESPKLCFQIANIVENQIQPYKEKLTDTSKQLRELQEKYKALENSHEKLRGRMKIVEDRNEELSQEKRKWRTSAKTQENQMNDLKIQVEKIKSLMYMKYIHQVRNVNLHTSLNTSYGFHFLRK